MGAAGRSAPGAAAESTCRDGGANPTRFRGLIARARRVRWRRSPSGHADAAGYLAIAFPVSMLLGDPRIVHGGLDLPGHVNRPRSDRVFARCGTIPVEEPYLPSKFRLIAVVDGRL